MAEWARRMACRRAASTTAVTLAPLAHHAADQVALVDDELAVFLRVGDVEFKAVADELAGVADLAAAFAVERRAIEHDANQILVADFFHLVAQVIVRRLAGDDALDRGLGFGRLVTEELGRVERLLERIDRPAGITACCTLPETSPCSSIAAS